MVLITNKLNAHDKLHMSRVEWIHVLLGHYRARYESRRMDAAISIITIVSPIIDGGRVNIYYDHVNETDPTETHT